MTLQDPVSVIEAAYDLSRDTNAWLESVAAASSATLGSAHGAIAFEYDASDGKWVHVLSAAAHKLGADFLGQFFDQPQVTKEAAAELTRIFLSADVGYVAQASRRLGASLDAVCARFGFEEMFALNARAPGGRGCLVCIADRARKLPTRSAALLQRLGAHIAAGARLRAVVGAVATGNADPVSRAEAVLTPQGGVAHAVGRARARSSQLALQDALSRIDAARGRRVAASRAVELWRALVDGRWSIVEHFERDGKRYYLAHENAPELARDFCLSPREQQVLTYANMGYSNKLIGYTLGLSRSSVSTLLTRARRKLGPASAFVRVPGLVKPAEPT